MRELFAIPGFTRVYTGLTVSAFGDWMLLLVLGIWVKQLTGSSGLAGLTMFFVIAPSLVAPALGVWIDRVRRKQLLVWANALSALAVLPLLVVDGPDRVWVVYTVAGLYGLSSAVIEAGVNGLVKELVPADDLIAANSALQTSREALRLVGPLVGAALFGVWGGGAVAAVDAASFVVAALAIFSIALRQDAPAPAEQGLLRELTAGLRHIASDRVLHHALIGFGIMALLLGLAESTVYAIVEAFGQPATFVAVVITVQGIGAVAGALAAGPLLRRVGEVAGLVCGLVTMALGLIIVALAPTLAVLLPAAGVVGVSIPVLIVAMNTLLQSRTPQRILGRASTVLGLLMSAPTAISIAAGAWLVAIVDFRVIFAAMAAASLLGAAHIAWWLRADLRPARPAATSC